MDYLSKWTKEKALPTNDATIVGKFITRLFMLFGTLHTIISDMGVLTSRVNSTKFAENLA